MNSDLFFQYCQKIVVLSTDKKSVLLAKRKGEIDYNQVYSFIGGKMEATDQSIVAGIQREKNEEVGQNAKIKILPNETYNIYFKKSDGNSMILPHIPAIFVSGDIKINDEYDDFKWISLEELVNFEPKIENIPKLTNWALNKINQATVTDFIEI